MSRTTRFTATLAAAGIVAAGFMGPASAAPANKGTTYVVPSDLTSSVLAGVARPGSFGTMGAGFGIVGNPNDGTIEHVGGLFVNGASGTLQLRNFTIDTGTAKVSGIVNGFGRVDLFTFAPNDSGSVDLFFTPTASFAVTGDAAAIAGAFAGTAKIVMP